MSPVPRREVVSNLFRTTNLNLAAYLVATNRLSLDHVQARPNSHSEFYFRDPDDQGVAIQQEFFTKDVQVSAKLILEARSSLLNELKRGGTQ